MKLSSFLSQVLLAFCICSGPVAAETYKDTFECTFDRGLANRPTPTRVLFSLDEFGRSALMHEVDIPKVETSVGSAKIQRSSIRVLSILWSGRDYSYSASGKSVTTSIRGADALDLRKMDFTLFLDRRTMKAIARSKFTGQRSKDGNAEGRCQSISLPN